MPKPTDEFVTLSPVQLAVLLDLPREDSVYLSLAPVRLPAAWYEMWVTRAGPRELTPAEVAMVSGLSPAYVRRAMITGAVHHLTHRVVSHGRTPQCRIAPAAVLHLLRELHAEQNYTPSVVETPMQRSKRAQRAMARLQTKFSSNWGLTERSENPTPTRSSRQMINLYLTTHRKCCLSVAANGFSEQNSGAYGRGVYLMPFVELVPGAGSRNPEVCSNLDIGPLDAERVVFEFLVPTATAAPFARGGYEYRPPEHPEYDPERDTPDPYFPDRIPPDTWVVPADVANRFCEGLKFWSGRRPLDDGQLHTIDARRDKPRLRRNRKRT